LNEFLTQGVNGYVDVRLLRIKIMKVEKLQIGGLFEQ
jgi:hypothetical protein